MAILWEEYREAHLVTREAERLSARQTQAAKLKP
jgi:hypothetical protein